MITGKMNFTSWEILKWDNFNLYKQTIKNKLHKSVNHSSKTPLKIFLLKQRLFLFFQKIIKAAKIDKEALLTDLKDFSAGFNCEGG